MLLILLIPEIEWLVEEKCVLLLRAVDVYIRWKRWPEYHRDIGVTFLTWASKQPQPQCNKHLNRNFLATTQNILVSCNKQTRVIYFSLKIVMYSYFILLHAVYGDEEYLHGEYSLTNRLQFSVVVFWIWIASKLFNSSVWIFRNKFFPIMLCSQWRGWLWPVYVDLCCILSVIQSTGWEVGAALHG